MSYISLIMLRSAINDVTLKGGFAGVGELDADVRDFEAYETILSEDLNGDDFAVASPEDLKDEPTRAENSYHVVISARADETSVLDGFTITAGNANSTTPSGGGMYNWDDSNPTLINCTFSRNSANTGGGIYNKNSNPILTNCTFKENSAQFGGGMGNWDRSNPILTYCIFSGNSAKTDGGGLYNFYESNTIVTNCIFSGNSANHGGGWVV